MGDAAEDALGDASGKGTGRGLALGLHTCKGDSGEGEGSRELHRVVIIREEVRFRCGQRGKGESREPWKGLCLYRAGKGASDVV